jgi:(p)ppGpp synthase/HD superfamily hydrolase
VPYVGHLLGAASIVIDDGGDEDQVIAALLHDAPEDQGGRPVLD